MTDLDIIKDQIKDEISVDSEGKGSASIRAVARLCGVEEKALRHHFRGAEKKPSKLAQILVQYGFDPRTFSKTGVPDTAVALIVKYYAWMAGERCTDQARQVDMVFGAIGCRSWMQVATGWTPVRVTVQNLFGDVISREPLPWEGCFNRDWRQNAERLTGWKWEYRVMSKFINKHVYDYMPIDVRRVLDEVNPMDNKGHRVNKQYQHFTQDAFPLLKDHISTVLDLMKASVSEDQFCELMKARFKNVYQLRLFDKNSKVS
jgi:hypothetical protein